MSAIKTCPEFVAHPHIVEQKIYSANGEFKEIREGGCYICQMASASDEQGVNPIADALDLLGIPNDIHQTGGFNMCVYIKTGPESYIYASAEGFGIYESEEDYEGVNFFFGDDFNKQSATHKAQEIVKVMKEKNLKALEI